MIWLKVSMHIEFTKLPTELIYRIHVPISYKMTITKKFHSTKICILIQIWINLWVYLSLSKTSIEFTGWIHIPTYFRMMAIKYFTHLVKIHANKVVCLQTIIHLELIKVSTEPMCWSNLSSSLPRKNSMLNQNFI